MSKLKGWVRVVPYESGAFAIQGRVAEQAVPVKGEPHNIFAVDNNRSSHEWICSQSMSLSLDGSIETMKLWFAVIEHIKTLMAMPPETLQAALYELE